MSLRAVVATACLALAVGCGGPSDPGPGPDVFLISLDAVRRDAVGVYRASGPSPTPEIDAFAASCVRFDQAWAPVPFTLSSHMSLITGLHPESHRVTARDQVLAEGIPTLAELASGAGYSTLGLVSNIWMKGEFGFARGFDHFERVRFGLTYAERINMRLFELLDQRRNDEPRPIFAFLHYIDAHSDYDSADTNLLPYSSSPELLAELGLTATSTDFCDDEGNCATRYLTAANRSGRALDEATVARIADLYLAGVRLLDRRIGELLHGLDERGLLDDALVIITSDHGEEFREHGRFVHAQPYVESLAVPLLVRFPGGAHGGSVVEDPVELADLMPSVLAAIGVDPPPHIPARDLFSPLGSGGGIPPGPVLGADKNRHRRFALRDRRHTLIVDFATGERELYDRLADSGEHVNLADVEPDTTTGLERALRETLQRYRKLGRSLGAGGSGAAVDALSDEEAEQLRAIGYLE